MQKMVLVIYTQLSFFAKMVRMKKTQIISGSEDK